MRYGLPYIGSKNKIAEWVVSHMPQAEHLYDVFCGGCAVTHRAILEDKFKHYHINDIEPTAQTFIDAINGEFSKPKYKEWISREQFFARKDSEMWIALCYSYCNIMRTYAYSESIEEYKRLMHMCAVYGGIENTRNLVKYLLAHADQVQSDVVLEHLTRVQSLESLTRVHSLASIDGTQTDYRTIAIEPNSIVYCDPPYVGNKVYKSKFDFDAFYDWCLKQTEPILISERWMPSEFVEVDAIKHNYTPHQKKVTRSVERLFTTPKFIGVFDR